MFQPLTCIALRQVRHSDRHLILIAFSRERGRVALLLPAASTPKASAMRSITQPMCRFECVANITPAHDIFNIRDVRRMGPPPPASPVKGALALFAADFTASLLREPQPDTNLFDFLCIWSSTLASATPASTANLHIAFLLALMQFMGITPDWSTFSKGYVFDMEEGIFRPMPPLHPNFLAPSEAEAAFRLRRLTIHSASKFSLSRADRNRIIDLLLRYYRVHFPSLGTLNSIAVLRSLFDF